MTRDEDRRSRSSIFQGVRNFVWTSPKKLCGSEAVARHGEEDARSARAS